MLRSSGGALEAVVIVPASGVIHTPLKKYEISYRYIEVRWRPQALGVFGARWLHLWRSWTNFAKFVCPWVDCLAPSSKDLGFRV